jgi:hypothetical protein
MLITLAVIANAFGRRFAGGLLAQWAGSRLGGTHVARLAQAAIAGATVAAFAPAWWWGLAAIPAVWAGATMGFGKGGMVPRDLGDVLDLAVVHGLASVAPVAALLAALHVGHSGWTLAPVQAALWLSVAGLLRGPAYWLATLWTPHCPALGLINRRSQGGPIDPPPFAEFIAGGLLGLAIALSF